MINYLDYASLSALVNFDSYDTDSIVIIQNKFSKEEIAKAIEYFFNHLKTAILEDTKEVESISLTDIAPIIEYLLALEEECSNDYPDDLVWFDTPAGTVIWHNIIKTDWLRKNIFDSESTSPRYFNSQAAVKIIYQD